MAHLSAHVPLDAEAVTLLRARLGDDIGVQLLLSCGCTPAVDQQCG